MNTRPDRPVTLRPCTVKDSTRLLPWIVSRRSLVRWAGPTLFRFPLDDRQLETYVRAAAIAGSATRVFTALDPDGHPVGFCELAGIHPEQGTATLCRVLIDPALRGKGWCGRVIRAALDAAFRSLNLRRVTLKVYADNAPAIRCYEREGFVREGVLRQAVTVDGELWDTVIMGILKQEWEARTRETGARSPEGSIR